MAASGADVLVTNGCDLMRLVAKEFRERSGPGGQQTVRAWSSILKADDTGWTDLEVHRFVLRTVGELPRTVSRQHPNSAAPTISRTLRELHIRWQSALTMNTKVDAATAVFSKIDADYGKQLNLIGETLVAPGVPRIDLNRLSGALQAVEEAASEILPPGDLQPFRSTFADLRVAIELSDNFGAVLGIDWSAAELAPAVVQAIQRSPSLGLEAISRLLELTLICLTAADAFSWISGPHLGAAAVGAGAGKLAELVAHIRQDG